MADISVTATTYEPPGLRGGPVKRLVHGASQNRPARIGAPRCKAANLVGAHAAQQREQRRDAVTSRNLVLDGRVGGRVERSQVGHGLKNEKQFEDESNWRQEKFQGKIQIRLKQLFTKVVLSMNKV